MPVLVNASDDRMMHDVPAMASDKDMDNKVLFIAMVVLLTLLSLRLKLAFAWRPGALYHRLYHLRRSQQIQIQ